MVLKESIKNVGEVSAKEVGTENSKEAEREIKDEYTADTSSTGSEASRPGAGP